MSHPKSLGGIDRAAADFHELGERAAKRGFRVAFEALAWGRHINAPSIIQHWIAPMVAGE